MQTIRTYIYATGDLSWLRPKPLLTIVDPRPYIELLHEPKVDWMCLSYSDVNVYHPLTVSALKLLSVQIVGHTISSFMTAKNILHI